MLIYSLMIISCLISAILLSKKYLKITALDENSYQKFSGRSYKKLRYYLIFLFIGLLPILVMGLRYNVGTDYAGTYTADYYLIRDGYRTRIEPISYLVYKLALFLSNDIQMYFFITSFICVYFSIIGIYKVSVSPIYTLLLYFITYQYFTSSNGVRQSCASAIILFGLSFLFEKKILKFLIIVIIAGLLHYSAFLYVILIPLYYWNLSFLKSFVIMIVGSGSIYLLKPIIYHLISYTPYRVYLYVKTDFGVSAFLSVINILIYIVMGCINSKNNRFRLLMNVQMLLVALSIIQFIIPLTGRLVQLFSIFNILSLPEISFSLKNKKIKLIFDITVVCFYTAYMLYGMLYSNWDNVLPYKSVFSK